MTLQQRPLLMVLGGNSDIGIAVAREFASDGYNILLAARKITRLEGYIADFSVRYGVELTTTEFDITAYQTHSDFINNLKRLPDVILCAAGTMFDQSTAERDFALINSMVQTNYLGTISILELFATQFEKRGSGRIIGLSSIAGMRGRASNYLYGSTKAAFSVYLEGLQHRLKKSSVRVDIIKPGFVKTRMTREMNLSAAILTEPEILAKKIALAKPNRREIFPDFKWLMIANIIRHLPNWIFLRTKL